MFATPPTHVQSKCKRIGRVLHNKKKEIYGSLWFSSVNEWHKKYFNEVFLFENVTEVMERGERGQEKMRKGRGKTAREGGQRESEREREKERECVCVCVKQNRNAYLFLLLESMRQRISFLLSLWQMLSRHPRTKQIKEEREEEKQRGAADKEEHSYLC